MSVPPPHGYTPAPTWPPQPAGVGGPPQSGMIDGPRQPGAVDGPPQPGIVGGRPNPGPSRAPRSPITAVTGLALLLAALSTAIHFFWGGGTYSVLTVIPALQILSGLGAAVACFAVRGGAARPAAGVAAGLLLVTNLSFLLLHLEHARYYSLGANGNWLTIPASLGALIAIATVLIPTPHVIPHNSPAAANHAPAQPYSSPSAPISGPGPSAPAQVPGAAWQQPAAAPSAPVYPGGYPDNPAYPGNRVHSEHPAHSGNPGYSGAAGYPAYGTQPAAPEYPGGAGQQGNPFGPGHP